MKKRAVLCGCMAMVIGLALAAPMTVFADESTNQSILEKEISGKPASDTKPAEVSAKPAESSGDKATMSAQDISKGKELDKFYADMEKKAKAFADQNKGRDIKDIPWPDAKSFESMPGMDFIKNLASETGSRALSADDPIGKTAEEVGYKKPGQDEGRDLDGSRWLGCCCCNHVYGSYYWSWRIYRVYRIYHGWSPGSYYRWYCCCCY